MGRPRRISPTRAHPIPLRVSAPPKPQTPRATANQSPTNRIPPPPQDPFRPRARPTRPPEREAPNPPVQSATATTAKPQTRDAKANSPATRPAPTTKHPKQTIGRPAHPAQDDPTKKPRAHPTQPAQEWRSTQPTKTNNQEPSARRPPAHRPIDKRAREPNKSQWKKTNPIHRPYVESISSNSVFDFSTILALAEVAVLFNCVTSNNTSATTAATIMMSSIDTCARESMRSPQTPRVHARIKTPRKFRESTKPAKKRAGFEPDAEQRFPQPPNSKPAIASNRPVPLKKFGWLSLA